jgi:resuscitation-promoting factor RpfB
MSKRQQWRATGVLTLAIAVLAGSLVTYVSAAKSVVLIVDGKTQRVPTMTATVQDLLQHADVKVGQWDVVTPALSSPLVEHAVVTVKLARPIDLDVDGVQSTTYVTALDVDTALTELGIGDQAWVNLARSTPIDLEGVKLKVREPKRVVIAVGGTRKAIVTTAPNVKGALSQAGIRLGKLDRLNVTANSPLRKGLLISITRVAQERVTKVERIKFRNKKVYDNTMLEYKQVVKSSGRNGSKQITFLVTYENGKVTKREVIKSVVLSQPKNAVVVIGTKKRTLEQLNWTRLAKCESHGNPRAVSRGSLYFGMFQFSLTAWKSVGGTGRPSDASASEQIMRAKLLYKKRGASPWPHCGRLLFTD